MNDTTAFQQSADDGKRSIILFLTAMFLLLSQLINYIQLSSQGQICPLLACNTSSCRASRTKAQELIIYYT